MKWKTKSDLRKRRHLRVRNKISGSSERPRMAIFKSNKHLYVQFIDDLQANTLASASTVKGSSGAATVEAARKLGQAAAEAAKAKGIEAVVFDRGGFKFGGQVKALADGAREGGLKF
jgi:large subunit ribosomal protein L18